MKRERRGSHDHKKFNKKEAGSSEKKERPFEKFRQDNKKKKFVKKPRFKERGEVTDSEEKSTGQRPPFKKRWEKRSFDRKDQPSGKFRQDYKKKTFFNKPEFKEKEELQDPGERSTEQKPPFKRWEKTSSERRERPSGKYRDDDKNKRSFIKREYKDGGDVQNSGERSTEQRPQHKRWEKPSVFFKRKKEESFKKYAEQKDKDSGLIRLNKYIANAGLCSRREADHMIENGLVSVNGKIVTQLGTKINTEDIVKYGGEILRREKPVYVVLNKPKDYITTVKDTHERRTVMELVKNAGKERLYPVGRLDRNTTGVLLLTNDGELTRKLTHPRFGAKKVYHVETDKNISHTDLKKLTEGIVLDDGTAKADEAHYAGEHLGKNEVGIVLHSGKNRVVRRMFEALGYEVTKLDRVSFAGLTKKDLPRGRWRFLTQKEIGFLKMLKTSGKFSEDAPDKEN